MPKWFMPLLKAGAVSVIAISLAESFGVMGKIRQLVGRPLPPGSTEVAPTSVPAVDEFAHYDRLGG